MPEHFLPLENDNANWLQLRIQSRGMMNFKLATINNFETSNSKKLSVKKYKSTKMQKSIYIPSRFQPLLEDLRRQMATNIG